MNCFVPFLFQAAGASRPVCFPLSQTAACAASAPLETAR
jgi:hypothetical protein